MITSVTGSFQRFGADIMSAGDDLSKAKVAFWAEVASETTGDEKRDAHLKSPEFIDEAKHPRITFVSKGAKEVDHDGSWDMIGDLMINGVTKPIILGVEWGGVMKDPWGNTKAGITISGKINRKEWHLNWNAALEAGGVLVSDEVRILCEVQLTKQG